MSTAGTRPLILVVDDEHSMQDMLSSVLAAEGFPHEVARGGQEAIDILATSPTKQRIMLLDLTMPVPGASVVRWLVEHPDIRAHTKIILMSANHNLRAAMDLVHDDELAKPFGVDTLLALIEKLT
jgi:CheY-like chemotaxis protein